MWNKLSQSMLGGDDDDEEEDSQDNLLYDSERLCSLSHLQRLYAFAACFVTGFVCMILSMIVFISPVKFAVLFTFGNMLAIGSTAFLIGPAQQIRMMFDPVRMYATAIYVGCVVLALICALGIHSKVLTIIAIICEICALICSGIGPLCIYAILYILNWLTGYSLSYIPFAHRVVSEVTIRLFDTEI